MTTTITVTAPITVTATVAVQQYLLLLTASANSRYLIDGALSPTLLVGDSAWSGIAQLTTAEMDTYLEDRVARGFNVVLVSLLEHYFSDNAPNDIDDNAPFTGANWTTPNSTYFTHADHFIDKALSLSLYVLLCPLYLGVAASEEGWDTEIAAASTDDMTDWGEYVGSRYVNYDNIIWCLGGDRDPTALLTKVNAFAAGLQTYDTRHLITFHDARGTMAEDNLGGASWLTLNNIYTTYLGTTDLTDNAYAVSPTIPFFQIEGYYENRESFTTQNARAQAYWTILDGGCGHIFGNGPLWHFGSTPGGGGDWEAELDDAGSLSMTRFSELFASKNWHLLAPDSSTNTVLTAGYGTRGAADFAPCGYASNGSLAMIYMPSNRTMTVDMSEFSGSVTCRWYDPTDGSYTADAASPHANSGTHDFSRAATNSAGDADWVLVLEA